MGASEWIFAFSILQLVSSGLWSHRKLLQLRVSAAGRSRICKYFMFVLIWTKFIAINPSRQWSEFLCWRILEKCSKISVGGEDLEKQRKKSREVRDMQLALENKRARIVWGKVQNKEEILTVEKQCKSAQEEIEENRKIFKQLG